MAAKIAAVLAALAVALAGPAAADQRDPRLDGLFQRLRAPIDDREARRVELRIWGIWIEADDRAAGRLMAQGIEAMELRRLSRALEHLDRLVALTPDFAEAWNKRATVHYLMGDFSASVRDIQQTLALEPRHFGALSGLGLIYQAIEQPAAALRSLEAALAINPHLEGARQRVLDLRREVEGSRT